MRAWLLVLSVVALAGCQKATELLVVLSTDVPDGAYDALSVEVKRAGVTDPQFSRTYLVPGETELPASIELHPTSGAPVVDLEVALLRNGAAEVTRRAVVPFARDRALLLRLELEAACVGVPCDPGQTCVGGACQTDMIDPTTLGSIPQHPLDPVDSGVADLASDLASGGDLAIPADLQPLGVDLADPCPPVPAAPSPSANCTVYAPGMAAFFDTEFFQITGSATATLDCNGQLIIKMPAGTHTVTNGGFEVLTQIASTASYTVTAGYWAERVVGGHAGLAAVNGSQYAVLYTAPTTGTFATDDLYFQAGGSGVLDLAHASMTGTHTLGMQRSVDSSQHSSYTVTQGANVTIPAQTTTVSQANQFGFFVGNDATEGAQDAIEVHLGWIEVCQ